MREPAREPARCGRGIARADDRDRGALEQSELALGHQQRRGIVHLGEQPRVQPLPQRDVARAEPLYLGDLALGVGSAEQAGRASPTAAREIRHGRQCRRRIAEARDQLPKRNRPDTRRADQPQAIDQVAAQTPVFPMRGSVPAASRAMFTRCFHTTSNAKPSSIGKR